MTSAARGFGPPAEVALWKRAYVLAELEVRLAIVEELHPDYWPRWVSVLAECIEAGSPEYDADGPPYKLPARISNSWTSSVVDEYTAKGSEGAVLRSAILDALEQAHHDDFEEFFAEACSRCRCALSYPCAGVLGADELPSEYRPSWLGWLLHERERVVDEEGEPEMQPEIGDPPEQLGLFGGGA